MSIILNKHHAKYKADTAKDKGVTKLMSPLLTMSSLPTMSPFPTISIILNKYHAKYKVNTAIDKVVTKLMSPFRTDVARSPIDCAK